MLPPYNSNRSHKEDDVGECGCDHDHKRVVVVLPHAVVNPHAVVVEIVDASDLLSDYLLHILQWREVVST